VAQLHGPRIRGAHAFKEERRQALLGKGTNNTIGRRDLILRAQSRYLAGGKKRTLAPDCFQMFFDYFGRR
jgi:hypothetical protein